MARKHGRNGRLYVAIASAGVAEPITFLRDWSINFAVDNVDVTAFGDTNKVYVAGLPDSTGSFSGFYDDATQQLYTAATDGVARAFYLYPDTSSTTKYWFGTALFDFNVSAAVDGSVDISGDWNAASAITRISA
jgi:hypothetical protein